MNDYSKTEKRQAGSQPSKQRNRETKTTRERETDRDRDRQRQTETETDKRQADRLTDRTEWGESKRERERWKIACSVSSLIQRKQCQA